jgi:hypothetical protein
MQHCGMESVFLHVKLLYVRDRGKYVQLSEYLFFLTGIFAKETLIEFKNQLPAVLIN